MTFAQCLKVIPMLVLPLAAVLGCREPDVRGGTMGSLTSHGEPLSDVQVTVHEASGSTPRPVGSAVTRLDGTFELLVVGASGPLWLPPGQYVCTVETAGAPVAFPVEFSKPESTPLRVSWTSDSQTLDLVAPSELLRH
ncbi:MAG: hypothetical protein KF774_04115 [Planctomyces sp.]|nr:hypothetical protein [Planctomyces sp.]